MHNKNYFTKMNVIALWIGVLVLGHLMNACGQNYSSKANPEAIVCNGKARFTILTPELIRLEWAESGQFEDRASLVFLHRRLPVPKFQTKIENGWLIIKTDRLALRYRENGGKFTAENLSISLELNGQTVTWHPGLEDTANLRGTTRTLDGIKGAASLEPGLISRSGWAVVDDSGRPLFDDSDWPWVIPRPSDEHQDWYFFGYGHNFKKALFDFTQVAGKIPLPPRFAFGLWWSRYWAYTDQEFKQLVQEFEMHDVPLDVLVIDMDWHQTFGLRWWQKRYDQAGQRLGWSGYTWDRNLFPDPEGFLQWCHRQGLKTTLNLHPASGVQPHEARYPEMAQAMGIDPATQKYVPFDIIDKKFAENYLKILHHPLEAQGVDFWWLDWQQQPTTRIAGVNPTWWLNYVHFTDMERRGKRPLIFHRWGGLGNHRYQIGFSGDAISVWESLAFQPYFTATAANVGYGYWSHDIGGHMPGEVSPELYTRWIQFGVFSPILRTHTTKNPLAERRIWAYPVDYFLIMREAILLRYALLPYIYTAARQAYDLGLSICRPLYYDYPEHDAAYQFKSQYLFGKDMLIAPITAPLSSDSMLVTKSIWLPPGEWIEWFTGERLTGPRRYRRQFALDEIPIYVKAGAIIPLQTCKKAAIETMVDPLVITIFSGQSGFTRIYEDEGNTLGYKNDICTWTPIRFSWPQPELLRLEILPVEGQFPNMPSQRSYEIRIPGVLPPTAIICNGQPIGYDGNESAANGWRYDGNKLQLHIFLPPLRVAEKAAIEITFAAVTPEQAKLIRGVPGKLARLRRIMPLLNSLWPQEWSPDILIEATQTGNRISIHPEQALTELQHLQEIMPEVVKQIEALKKVNPEVVERALAHLCYRP
ncbi:MAG: glycoside hydrolase family 31 protein [candidate division KSB1 bacterium]|nr:glycoside hydrolase family 31 protein [candidate division KSB1 bacterium]